MSAKWEKIERKNVYQASAREQRYKLFLSIFFAWENGRDMESVNIDKKKLYWAGAHADVKIKILILLHAKFWLLDARFNFFTFSAVNIY